MAFAYKESLKIYVIVIFMTSFRLKI
jgi:hypothetical protein